MLLRSFQITFGRNVDDVQMLCNMCLQVFRPLAMRDARMRAHAEPLQRAIHVCTHAPSLCNARSKFAGKRGTFTTRDARLRAHAEPLQRAMHVCTHTRSLCNARCTFARTHKAFATRDAPLQKPAELLVRAFRPHAGPGNGKRVLRD